jgi:hypothetical protein
VKSGCHVVHSRKDKMNIPSMLLKNADKIKFLLRDHSTTILTGVGVTGTAGTAYLTGRASLKAARMIDAEVETINTGVDPETRVVDPVTLSKRDAVFLVWRLYIPPVAAGLTTMTAIIAAHRLSSKKIAALVVASGLSERALQEYKDKVVTKLGERQSTTVRDEIAKDRIESDPVSNHEVIITGGGDVLCYDMLTGRYFLSTVENIKRAENQVNFTINQHDYASLSEFYEAIGLKPTAFSDNVGFNTYNHCEVQFTTVMSEDNRPCIAVNYLKMPVPEYDRVSI